MSECNEPFLSLLSNLGINRIKYLWVMNERMSNEWMNYEQYFWDYYQTEEHQHEWNEWWCECNVKLFSNE